MIEDLRWLVREYLSEPAELFERDASSARIRAGAGLLRGGLDPEELAKRVKGSGARIVHAHNLHPTLGWRALAAARAAGARVIMHLHQYRLVCATGVCFTNGEQCTRCHGPNTLPGLVHNCRGSRSEAVTYALALALYQRRVIEQVDAFIVPSVFARERLRGLGAPLPWERVHVLAPPLRSLASAPPQRTDGPDRYALVVSRLAAEKGIDVAIRACQIARIPLMVAGEGPERAKLEASARGGDVRFLGHMRDGELRELRAGAAVALVPSRSPETFGLAAAEAMVAGVPVIASRVGALPELVEKDGLVDPGDPEALALAIARLDGDRASAQRGRTRISEICAPENLARRLAEIYDSVF